MEVNQLYVILDWRKEENTFRLQVHVNNLILVQVCDSAEHLRNDLSGILFWDKHTAVDILIDLTQQVTTLAEFSNNEEALAVLEDLLEA